MLAPNRPDGWAQIGFVSQNTTSSNPATGWDHNHFFMQWWRGNGYAVHTLYWGTPSSGSSWKFQATRQAGDGRIHLLKDGISQWETDFDPLDAWGSTGRNAEFFAEITNKGSDFYGTSGNRTDYAQVQSKTVDGWANQNWNYGGSNLCYGKVNELTSNSHFEVWTSPLDHNC